eukprot:scaffold147_cov164-Ochromonas_danica.AAC.7
MREESPFDKVFHEWSSGGLANAIASAILNPIDVVKTRLQALSPTANPHTIIRIRPIIQSIWRESGVIGLWKPGLAASMSREMLNSGPRAGFYVPIRDSLQDLRGESADSQSWSTKLLAALTTGIIGSLTSNPIDVIKIRMMVDTRKYPSILLSAYRIMSQEGIIGFYKGVAPSTLRGKPSLLLIPPTTLLAGTVRMFNISSESWLLHVTCSMITGLVAATVAAPFDLLKTRAMNTANANESLLGLGRRVVEEEGALVLFRGWLPAYLRLGPHAIICFPVFEQLRRLFGLNYL